MCWWFRFSKVILTGAAPASDIACRSLGQMECSCCCWCACNVVEQWMLLESVVVAVVVWTIGGMCGWRRIQCRFVLFKLLEKIRRLEVLGHWIVHPRDNLVDGLFPRLLGILATLNGAEKFAQCLLHHKAKILRYLRFFCR